MLTPQESLVLLEISRACHSRNLSRLQEEFCRHRGRVKTNARVFGDYFATDISDAATVEMLRDATQSPSPSKASLLMLSLKFCDEEVVRFLVEQGADVLSEELYTSTVLGIWREDGFDKALALLDMTEVSDFDNRRRFANAGLCHLSADRLLPLLRFLQVHNYRAFETLYCTCRAEGVEHDPRDPQSEELQQFMRENDWVAMLRSDDYR